MSELLKSLLEEWYYAQGLPPAETPGWQLWHYLDEHFIEHEEPFEEDVVTGPERKLKGRMAEDGELP